MRMPCGRGRGKSLRGKGKSRVSGKVNTFNLIMEAVKSPAIPELKVAGGSSVTEQQAEQSNVDCVSSDAGAGDGSDDWFEDFEALGDVDNHNIDFDMSLINFKGLDDVVLPDATCEMVGTDTRGAEAAPPSDNMEQLLAGKLDLGPGFSPAPDPELLATSFGQDAQKSASNDCWSLIRANQLRKKLG
jgi:hypothetical protein